MNTKVYANLDNELVIEGSISKVMPILNPNTPTEFEVGAFTIQCRKLMSGDWTFGVIHGASDDFEHLGFHNTETPDDYTEGIALNLKENATVTLEQSEEYELSLL